MAAPLNPQSLQPPTPPSRSNRWYWYLLDLIPEAFQPKARLLGFSLLVGVIAGLAAIVFFIACQAVSHFALGVGAGYHAHGPGGEPPLFAETDNPLVPWMLLLIPTVGGLISGSIVFTLAPEAEGHGTDSVIAAYHYHQGKIRPQVPLVKLVASAITLGTGGSGGREGPIAQIGAGFGSFLANLLRLRPAECRVLMAAGMGAGVAAIFRAPLAGALFAAEVLYRSPDFESEVIMPAALASVTAYCTFGVVFGWAPLFTLPPEIQRVLVFDNPWHLGPYLVLALFMVGLALIYTRTFYGLTSLFHRLPMPRHFKPALGAFLSALVGVGLYVLLRGEERVLSVLSFGYGILQDALTLAPSQETSIYLAVVLLLVALGKIVTTGLTIGSGGSGGVFGPSMVIGGCGGGALGMLLRILGPQWVPHPATFVIVGMAGFFAAAAKTPVSTLVMVSELTGNYNLLLPTLWVCTIAFLFSDPQSIYSSQVASRSRSPAHRGNFAQELLAGLQVAQFLTPLQRVPVLHPGDRLDVIHERMSTTPYHVLPVADNDGRLLGVVSLEEVLLASRSPEMGLLVVAVDLMRSGVEPLRSNDTLTHALELFVESELTVLPVLEEGPDNRLIGVVNRADLTSSYLRLVKGVISSKGV